MTPLLANHDGWWWPAADTDARGVITRDCEPAIKALLGHVPGRDIIVQAGANVGVYPVALARHFDVVMTAEPDPANYECAKRNLKAHDERHRVFITHAAFGEAEGWCSPQPVKATNCGAHRVVVGQGAVRVLPIDALRLPACDAIWLDIEGSELLALKGAEATIEQFSPVIAVEDKGLHRAFGIEDGALQSWLADRGYAEVSRIGLDKVFTRKV